MIDKTIIEQIKSAADIHQVVGDFVSLKKRGVNYLGLCPFHNEKTPSFTVSPAKGIFKCFGCGKSGDSITFLMEHEKLSYTQALRFLAKKYHIDIPEKEVSKEEKEKMSKRESMMVINRFAQKYFQNRFGDHALPKNYMYDRGFDKKILKKFGIGYNPDSWTHFLNHAQKNGYRQELLLELGLIFHKKETDFFGDRFRHRVIFPYFSLSGQIIGFTGRSLTNDKKQAKYLNSPESDLFHKGNVLYGFYQAKEAIRKANHAYLVEGNTDVMAFHQATIENTIATSGTALTQAQVKLIRRFAEDITIIFDADPAGVKAAIRGIDICLAEGLNVNIITLPKDEDPDSFSRKHKPEKLAAWLNNNTVDFISYRAKMLADEAKADPNKKSELIKSIVDSIACVPDEIDRDVYMQRAAEILEVGKTLLQNSIGKKVEEIQEEVDSVNFFDQAQDAIKDANLVYLVNSQEEAIGNHLGKKQNTLLYNNMSTVAIRKLKELTLNIKLASNIDLYKEDSRTFTKDIDFCQKLLENGFNIKLDNYNSVPNLDLHEEPEISFMDWFTMSAIDEMDHTDDKDQKETIERVAEMLSKCDNTTINLKQKKVAKRFGLTETAFNKILKPFLNKLQNTKNQRNDEVTVDGETQIFEMNNLPDYVDKKFFYKYRFFPAQNKKNEKIFYVFQTTEGNLLKVGNFYMEPMFQVFDLDPDKNKRVVRLRHAELNKSEYVEIRSRDLIDFSAFKKFLWDQGGYVFSRGKNYHHESVMESIALEFPKCYEFNVFGWQHEGFYAFTNAIYGDGEIIPVNELGLVKWKEETYYSPAFSIIYKDLRKDNDKFAQDRFFVYKENKSENPPTFENWAQLMKEVYKNNNNGMWAIVYALMSAYRSIIYQIDRLFTSLFFIGPTECGKSQIAISIRSVFMDPTAPLFNLNSGTDAAFFTTLERFRDVPVVYEEYNDYQITDVKFQGLKAAVYDGEGKTKRKDASSKDLDISQVNSAPVLLGQEAPERDDGSLYNRCVICHVPKKDDWTEAEADLFKSLKDLEKGGLSNILIEIMKRRPLVQQHFQKQQRIIFKELKKDLQAEGNTFQTRILNTVSLFCAMVKVYEKHAAELKLPFTYEEFYQVAKKKIIQQSEAISSTNRMSIFFNTMQVLLNRERGGITMGKEFKIEIHETVKVRIDKKTEREYELHQPTKVLFIRLNVIHPLYKDIEKGEALKMNALMTYFRDHPAWIGNVKSTQFKWEEETRVAANIEGKVESKMRTARTKTSAIALNYEMLMKEGIDLEKFDTEAPALPFITEDDTEDNKNAVAEAELEETTDDLPY